MTAKKNTSKKVSDKINPVVPEKKIVVPVLTAQQTKSKANFEYKNFTGSIFKVLNYILESKEKYHLDYLKLKGLKLDKKIHTVTYIFDRMTVREQYKLNKLGEIVEPRLIHSYSYVMNALIREKK